MLAEKCKYCTVTEEMLSHQDLMREGVCSIPFAQDCPDDAGCPSDSVVKNCWWTDKGLKGE